MAVSNNTKSHFNGGLKWMIALVTALFMSGVTGTTWYLFQRVDNSVSMDMFNLQRDDAKVQRDLIRADIALRFQELSKDMDRLETGQASILLELRRKQLP